MRIVRVDSSNQVVCGRWGVGGASARLPALWSVRVGNGGGAWRWGTVRRRALWPVCRRDASAPKGARVVSGAAALGETVRGRALRPAGGACGWRGCLGAFGAVLGRLCGSGRVAAVPGGGGYILPKRNHKMGIQAPKVENHLAQARLGRLREELLR